MSYILGVDVGVASLGVSLITAEKNFKILAGAVRTYPIPEGARDRRLVRGARRGLERRGRRLDRLSELLKSHGIGYLRKEASQFKIKFPAEEEPQTILNYSPIKARAMASRGKVELGLLARALLHMARNRGSSAFSEVEVAADKEKLITKKAMTLLEAELEDKGFQTYGQYLRWREKRNLPTRINPQKNGTLKGEYAFYPSRKMLQREFECIWSVQSGHYSEILTQDLKDKVYSELFFQRSVTTPPPGKCQYFPDEERLAKCSRLFQRRRIFEECNNLKFYSKFGEPIKYDLDERQKLLNKLFSGEDLTFAKIKEELGLKKSDKVNLEASDTKTKLAGYPFNLALGAENFLGRLWHKASDKAQDSLLYCISTEHDDGAFIQAAQEIIGCNKKQAESILDVPLPAGWGMMGQTATEKVLAVLEKQIISSRKAEDIAKISHVMTPDGEIFDRLPYYGEILLGHTQAPMWVSKYRLDTDTPPATDDNEQKYGRIANPVVHLALNQIRRTINAIIDEYGLPKTIHIELSRDLNKSAEQRQEIVKLQEDNKRHNDEAAEFLIGLKRPVTRLNIQKYRLWKEQNCICIYTGNNISCTQLFNGSVEVDHILPRSKIPSDAMSNKVVCFKGANAEKSNRAPYQAFASNKDLWAEIMRRVDRLSTSKQKRFKSDALQEYEDDPDSFAARYGSDNAYIARVARQYLSCLYGDQTKVITVSSHVVALLRGKWGLQGILGSKKSGKKYRGDHRHHFIDALVTATASRSTIQKIQTEAARCERKGLEQFVESIEPPFGSSKEFFNAVKQATFENVRISRKPNHSLKGQLHQDRLLGIVDPEPNMEGKYLCRKRAELKTYSKLSELKKVKIQNTIRTGIAEVDKARLDLERITTTMSILAKEAELAIIQEQKEAPKGPVKAPTEQAIFKRALEMHQEHSGQSKFTLFEMNSLVNIQSSFPSNQPTGGFISGRNFRADFYVDAIGKLCWECISMLNANRIAAAKNPFILKSAEKGNSLLWSVHKDDLIEMDHPEEASRRILVSVAAISENKMGVVPIFDARGTTKTDPNGIRQQWNRRLNFYRTHGAQRVVSNEIGKIIFKYPRLR